MLDDGVERLVAGILEAIGNLLRNTFKEHKSRIAALESELAALRQIVADVETCIGGRPDNSVEIFTEPGLVSVDNEQFHAPTWQAALHAAAEHVRNANPERTENEV